jgi:hypothetical protein
MTTYRKLFSEEGYKSYRKQDTYQEERDDNFISPVKENNFMIENAKFLRIPQQFSNISSKGQDYNKVQEFPLPSEFSKGFAKIISSDDRISNKIIVVGFDPLYLNTVLSHFKKFGNIVDYEHFPNSNYLIINYSSQQESLYALNHYNKFLLNLTIKGVIIAEEEKIHKFERRNDKFSTIKTPSKKVGIYKFLEYIFNW